MTILVLKLVALLAAAIGGGMCLWFSTPWGYKKPLYRRLLREGALLDNPQLLRALGIGGILYSVTRGFWIAADAFTKSGVIR